MPLCGGVNDSMCMGWWLGQHLFYSVAQRRLLWGCQQRCCCLEDAVMWCQWQYMKELVTVAKKMQVKIIVPVRAGRCDKFIFGGWVQEAVVWRCQRH